MSTALSPFESMEAVADDFEVTTGGACGGGGQFEPWLTEQGDAIAPCSSWYVSCKVAGEWLVAVGLLALTAPLLLTLALLVKATSRGPAFYAQTRLGLMGRTYRMYKLRTMIHGAEADSGAVWAAKVDSRVTPIGKILRHTHLDELPQLFNILAGQMSLIGPRPERPEIAVRIERTLPHFRQRLSVRPGITGLAQMLLPADDPNDGTFLGTSKKLERDLWYIEHVSFFLDLRISVATACSFIAAATEAAKSSILRSCGAAITYNAASMKHRQSQEENAA